MIMFSLSNKHYFIVFGLFFLILGAIVYLTFDPDEYDREVEGTITGFVNRSIGDDMDIYTLVEYDVDGHFYRDVELNYYTAFLDVGDRISFYCKSSNPKEITAKGKDVMPYVAIGAMVVGLSFVTYALLKRDV